MCCRPLVARGAPCCPSNRRTRCTRPTRGRPAPDGSACRAWTTSRSMSPTLSTSSGVRRRASYSSPRPTTRPAPPYRSHVVEAICAGESRRRRRRRGLCGVPASRGPVRAEPAGRAPPARGRSHHVEGVRLRRRPRRLPCGERRRWSTRCDWCACRITFRQSRRRWPGLRSRTRARCWPPSTRLRIERDSTVEWLRAARVSGGRVGRELRAVRYLQRPARGLAGTARPRGAGQGDSARRAGYASRSAPRNRWLPSGRPSAP